MSDGDLTDQFDAEVNNMIGRIENAELQSIQRALDLLKQLQAEVRTRLAEGGSNFTVSIYKQVEKAIDNDIDQFSQQLQSQLNADMSKMAQLGEELIDTPTMIITGPVLSISGANVAQVAASYVPGLIRGLSNAANNAIAAILRRAVLGVASI